MTEHCCQCDAPTGRAGRADDSIYITGDSVDIGPLCEDCRDEVIAWCEAPAWHDRPTGPGLWLCVTAGKRRRLRLVTPRAAAHWYEKGRVFGPIPPDTEAT